MHCSNYSSPDEKCEWPVDTMAADIIVEMWEMAHVKDAAQLLENLGFTGKEVNVMRLSAIIDEELQDVQQSEKSFTPLLRVSTPHAHTSYSYSMC